MKMTDSSIITAGIDTSKDKLDIAIHRQAERLRVENTTAGWRQLAGWLKRAGVTRVGIEATGGYERGVMRYLQNHGLTVVLLQPLQVKAFAKVTLRRAKSDTLDAQLIAQCTHMTDAYNKMAPDPRFDAFADQLTFIEQMEEDLVRFKTRLEHVSEPRLRRIVQDDIKRLTRRRLDEIKSLRAAMRQHDDLAQRYLLVCSIPTIGARTALTIIVRMPELGQVSREEAAALAGLAPFVHESGKHKGQTHIGGGRAQLRRSLYLAALPGAFYWNPPLKAHYQGMIARGKSPKCALVACARKLLIFANAVVARGTPWEETPPATAA
jgi:transposase